MKTNFFIVAVLFAFVNINAFSFGDTVMVSYDDTPNVSIASIYREVVWKVTEKEKRQVEHLSRVDPVSFPLISIEMDSLSWEYINPYDIIPLVKKYNSLKYKTDYVRFFLTKINNNFRGVSSPIKIIMVFDKNGYLTSFQANGFIKKNDGFTLDNDILKVKNIHRSMLQQYGI